MIKAFYRACMNQVSARLAHRWNIITGIGTELVKLLTSIFLWKQIFARATQVKGYTFESMTTYLLVTALLGIAFSPTHMFRLSPLVRRGTLSAYLVRPFSFLSDSLAAFLGSRLVELAITGICALVLGFLGFIHLGEVQSAAALLVLSNFLLLFLFGSVVGTFSFWLIQMWPMKPLYNAMMALAGGALFPLDLFPGIVRQVLEMTPFPLFGFVNARALQGALSSQELGRYWVASIGWNAVCLALYSLLWRRGLKQYEGVNA